MSSSMMSFVALESLSRYLFEMNAKIYKKHHEKSRNLELNQAIKLFLNRPYSSSSTIRSVQSSTKLFFISSAHSQSVLIVYVDTDITIIAVIKEPVHQYK